MWQRRSWRMKQWQDPAGRPQHTVLVIHPLFLSFHLLSIYICTFFSTYHHSSQPHFFLVYLMCRWVWEWGRGEGRDKGGGRHGNYEELEGGGGSQHWMRGKQGDCYWRQVLPSRFLPVLALCFCFFSWSLLLLYFIFRDWGYLGRWVLWKRRLID